MTDALFDAITTAGAPELDGFWKAPAGFGSALTACSTNSPIAYIEADFVGGTGEQSAQIWDDGKVVLGPLHLAEGETHADPAARSPKRFGSSAPPKATTSASST